MKYEELKKLSTTDYESEIKSYKNNYKTNDNEFKDLSYDEARRKAFDFLNDNNVSVTTINGIMEDILYWAPLVYDDYIRNYIEKNKNKVQTKEWQGWEVTLDVLLDP